MSQSPDSLLAGPTPDELELQRLRAELAALAQAPRAAPDRAALEAALRQARAQRARNGTRYMDAHPVMQSLQSTITELEKMLGAESILPLSDTPPQSFSQNPEPDYPVDLRRKGVPGKVSVTVMIDASGRVTEAVATQATLPDFVSAAEAAAKKWIFLPATKDGAPVKQKMDIEVMFVSDEGPDWF